MKSYPEMKAPAGYIYRREKRDFGEYYDREELITCEDCAKCQIDNVYHDYWCNGKKVQKDHFCGYAERRTDE